MKKETTLLERINPKKKEINQLIETVSSIMVYLGIGELTIKIENDKGHCEMKAAKKTP